MTKKARIIGLGSYLPEKVLSNSDLEKMVDTTDEWIVTRTGMKERRIAEDQSTSDLGFESAKKALKDANLDPKDVELILFATITPDYVFPSTACLAQEKLGCTNAVAFDIQAACTGCLFALSVAKAYIVSGLYDNILVIASEKLSSIVDYEDRSTCVLFGDGASSCVVSSKGSGYNINHVLLGTDGSLANILYLPAGGSKTPASKETVEKKLHYISLNGQEVYKHAVRRMGSAAKQCIEEAGLKDEDISYMVPHQANMRIIDSLAKRFGFPKEKVFITLHKYGNTSASSVGIALDELIKEKPIKTGEHILLVAFGAGLTYGAAILTKED